MWKQLAVTQQNESSNEKKDFFVLSLDVGNIASFVPLSL